VALPSPVPSGDSPQFTNDKFDPFRRKKSPPPGGGGLEILRVLLLLLLSGLEREPGAEPEGPGAEALVEALLRGGLSFG